MLYLYQKNVVSVGYINFVHNEVISMLPFSVCYPLIYIYVFSWYSCINPFLGRFQLFSCFLITIVVMISCLVPLSSLV